MFRANVYANSPEYAYCYIAVPENNCGALNQTLTELGFNVKDVAILKPEQRMLLSYMHPHACLAIIEPQKENEKKALAFTGAITGMAETMWK